MSNSLAIAAVTATLQSMLINLVPADLPPDIPSSLNLGNTQVTTKPLDKARSPNETPNQINLFLYQTAPNNAMRNMDIPAQVKPGETGQPPAALDLYYLVTAYGYEDDDTAAHILLGQVMRIFHDNAVLSPSEIQAALPGNDLYKQVERVRITAKPLSLEEMSKLWTQTQYRISVAYQVSVVLIESKRPSITPLPVLTRGGSDEGVVVQPDLFPPFPMLQEVVLPPHQFSAQLGDVLTLRGFHLDGDTVEVRFLHPHLTAGIIRPPEPGSHAKQVIVKIPDVTDDPQAPAQWPSGFYTVSVLITKGGIVRVTNELGFMLAPHIEWISQPNPSPGDFPLDITCLPQVRPEQRVVLLFGSREIFPEPFSLPVSPSAPTTLNFQITAAETGTYFLRLRVDGVDSILVEYEGIPPMPVFDSSQKVVVS